MTRAHSPQSVPTAKPSVLKINDVVTAALLEDMVRGMAAWNVRGCALAVVPLKPGMGPPSINTFGKRNEHGDRVTMQTSFPLASCSKHITALALHAALERYGLGWGTKVKDLLPDFDIGQVQHATKAADANGHNKHTDAVPSERGRADSLKDCWKRPVVGTPSVDTTVEDLLCHRSGLAGWDVLYAPDLADGTLLDKLNHLPMSPKPQHFQYNSLLYDVAAWLIPRLTDLPLHQFVQQEFLDPLQLTATYFRDQVAEPAEGFWSSVREGEGSEEAEEDHAIGYGVEHCGEGWGAGRVWMTIEDVVKWIACATHFPGFKDIATPRIIDPDPGLFFADHPMDTGAKRGQKRDADAEDVGNEEDGGAARLLDGQFGGIGYGLGLRGYKHRGQEVLCHNGTIPGFASQITWLPKLDLGFAILTNSDPGGVYLRALLACKVIEAAAGLERVDWFAKISEAVAHTLPVSARVTSTHTPPAAAGVAASQLSGSWYHPSFGNWVITPDDICPAVPPLTGVPFLPHLCGTVLRCLAPCHQETDSTGGMGKQTGAAFTGWLEVRLHTDRTVHCGWPFMVRLLGKEQLQVTGLSGGTGCEGNDDLLVFTRAA